MSIKIVANNKKAFHDYTIIEKYEAGLVLKGSEVKSLRDQNCQLKDSYVSFKQGEAYLQNAHISPYGASSYNNHEPERMRKLLLHQKEINELFASLREKGLSIIPLKIYFKKGIAKVEIGLAKGKKHHDKRDASKKQSAKREIQQSLKKNR